MCACTPHPLVFATDGMLKHCLLFPNRAFPSLYKNVCVIFANIPMKVLWHHGVACQNNQVEWTPQHERHDKESQTGSDLVYFCDPRAWRWKTQPRLHLHIQILDPFHIQGFLCFKHKAIAFTKVGKLFSLELLCPISCVVSTNQVGKLALTCNWNCVKLATHSWNKRFLDARAKDLLLIWHISQLLFTCSSHIQICFSCYYSYAKSCMFSNQATNIKNIAKSSMKDKPLKSYQVIPLSPLTDTAPAVDWIGLLPMRGSLKSLAIRTGSMIIAFCVHS